MSNLLSEPGVEIERALFADLLLEPARTLRVAKLLGANAIIQLGEELTFSDIFQGEVPICSDSIVYDRNGRRLDATELVSQVVGYSHV